MPIRNLWILFQILGIEENLSAVGNSLRTDPGTLRHTIRIIINFYTQKIKYI